MSRIGIKPISVPAGVEVTVADGNVVTVKGPKGSLTKEFHKDMIIKCADGVSKKRRLYLRKSALFIKHICL